MFCPNCGSQLPDGSKFCANCGNRMQPETPVFQTPVAPVMPQTPPAQPVYRQPEAPKAPPVAPEIPKKKKKKSKLPIVIIALVLVAAIAVTCVLMFGKKKVWVLTESVTVNNGQESAMKYEYDEMGVLLSFERSISGTDTEYTYNYDDDGRIESVEMESDGHSAELIYSYDKNGVLEEISGEMDGGEIIAECNDDGQVETVEIYSGDELMIRKTYTYHDNGVLESWESETYMGGEVAMIGSAAYSETGKQLSTETEQVNTVNGYHTVVEQSYDEEDRLVGINYTFSYSYDESVTSRQVIEMSWENDEDGRIANPVVTLEIEEDGEAQSVTITGEVEYDDESCTITLGEIESDDLDEDELPMELEDMVIEIEYGEHGYIVEVVVEVMGQEFMSYSYEYTEVEVPRDYRKVIVSDPIWGMFA